MDRIHNRRKRNEAFMVLNRIFEPKNGDFNQDEIDNTNYIDPSKYNYIFAETAPESQNFWAQIGFGIEARRVMSAKQIPNLNQRGETAESK